MHPCYCKFCCHLLCEFELVVLYRKFNQTHCSYPGWPKVLWVVTESKHLSKPPRDWFPHVKDANQDNAYIEVTTEAVVSGWMLLLSSWQINRDEVERKVRRGRPRRRLVFIILSS